MSRLANALARAGRLYADGGLAAFGTYLRHRFNPIDRAYRRRMRADADRFDAAGYDTSGLQQVFAMETVGSHVASAVPHAASPLDEFAEAIAALDLPPEGMHFVDLGSGKGRAVLMAAEFPFAAITGVEFARELHAIAEANVARRGALRGPDPRIRLVHACATRFVLPDAPTTLFLYHPFDPPVMTTVVANALAAWRAAPRPFRVLYLNPVHQTEWTRAGWRLLRRERPFALFAPPEEAAA